MRPHFSDGRRLTRRALEQRKGAVAQVRRWWVGKYSLPANHDLFQSRSLADLQLEMLEDMADRREMYREQLRTAKGAESESLMRQINAISEVFGDKPDVFDPLIDKWE